MSYIGNEPIVSATRTVTEVTATAGQTVFNANGGYTVGYLDVFLNGSKLTTTDFTATDGSSITLTEAAQVGDIVRLEALGTFLTSSGLTANNPSYTGTLTGGTGVVNIGSGQVYKDASGKVGIGTNSPDSYVTNTLQINGTSSSLRLTDGTSGTTKDDGFELYLSGGTAGINQRENAAMTFLTNNTERMRIDSSGNLLVGTTAAGNVNSNSMSFYQPDGSIYVSHITGSSSGKIFCGFGYAGNSIGSITQNGTTAVAYNTTSDYRLKENVSPLVNALDRVKALKPVTYIWKAAPDEIGEGFIAHELAEVCPQAVTGEKDAVNKDGSIKPQSIDTSFLVATLTAAIQEQQAIIQSQADTITAMEARLTALEGKQ